MRLPGKVPARPLAGFRRSPREWGTASPSTLRRGWWPVNPEQEQEQELKLEF